MSSQKAKRNEETQNFINEWQKKEVECLLSHLWRQKYVPQMYQKIDGKIHSDG